MNNKSVDYICPKCQTEEPIPQSVIDFFNSADPDPLFDRQPSFRCENCAYPYMIPKKLHQKSSS